MSVHLLASLNTVMNRNFRLRESIDDDLTSHRLAIQAYRLVAQRLAQGTAPDFETDEHNGSGPYFGLLPQSLGFDKAFGITETALMFGLRSSNNPELTGKIVSYAEKWFNDQIGSALIFDCLRAFTLEDWYACATTDFVRVFIHEFIHLLDRHRTDDRIFSRNSAYPDKTSYYSDPAEFNAWYHNLADAWLGCLDNMRQHPEQCGEIADLYQITGDFTHDLGKLATDTRDGADFVENLTLPRQKSLLRRLYRLHQDIVAELSDHK